jgi:hypothetical protein
LGTLAAIPGLTNKFGGLGLVNATVTTIWFLILRLWLSRDTASDQVLLLPNDLVRRTPDNMTGGQAYLTNITGGGYGRGLRLRLRLRLGLGRPRRYRYRRLGFVYIIQYPPVPLVLAEYSTTRILISLLRF